MLWPDKICDFIGDEGFVVEHHFSGDGKIVAVRVRRLELGMGEMFHQEDTHCKKFYSAGHSPILTCWKASLTPAFNISCQDLNHLKSR